MECEGELNQASLIAVTHLLCVVAGYQKISMQGDLVYLIITQAFGAIGGRQVAMGSAPAQHALSAGLVQGFRCDQINLPVGYRDHAGFSIQIQRSGIKFRVSLFMGAAVAESTEGLSIRGYFSRNGGSVVWNRSQS